MQAIRSFGRAAGTDACTFTSYVKQPTHVGMRHGTEAAIYTAGLIAMGWAVGSILPVFGRPLGALVGAGVAGVKVYSGFASWKKDGGTTGVEGACDEPGKALP